MKQIGRSFYGRLNAYGAAIAAGDGTALAAALQRNLFPEAAGPDMAPLAGYGLRLGEAMNHLGLPVIRDGSLPLLADAEAMA
jgi:cytochrome b pre-mRNA-processing protein 3